MTIQVWIDGCPYLVTGPGPIEIERMFDGETVAFRGPGQIVVLLDEFALAEYREAILTIESRAEKLYGGLSGWFADSRSSMGGSKVRAGYD